LYLYFSSRLWIAYEPNLKSCLMMMHLSRERTIFVCYQFFRQLRNRYGSRKPIFTDGAGWYNNDACKWLGLKHEVYGNRLKNLMERKICTTDKRRLTECFDDHFPCRKHNCHRQQHVWNWLKLLVLYLHVGKYRIQFITFLVTDRG
jgi:transposase-like protein